MENALSDFSVIAVKKSMHGANPEWGRIKVLLCQDESKKNGWVQGNSQTIPEKGNVFTTRGYERLIHGKYSEGEAFQIPVTEGDKDLDCFYVGKAQEVRDIDRAFNLSTVLIASLDTFDLHGETIIETSIRPIGPVFVLLKQKNEIEVERLTGKFNESRNACRCTYA